MRVLCLCWISDNNQEKEKYLHFIFQGVAENLGSFLHNFSNVVSSSLVSGQAAVNVVKTSFRMSCQSFSSDLSDVVMSSLWPKISGVKPQSVMFPFSANQSGWSVFSFSHLSVIISFHNSNFVSNPLQVVLSGGMVHRAVVTLQNNQAMSLGIVNFS